MQTTLTPMSQMKRVPRRRRESGLSGRSPRMERSALTQLQYFTSMADNFTQTPGSEQTLTKPAAGSKHDGSSANCGSPSEPASAQPNTSKSSTLHKLSIHEEMAKRDRNIAENRELMASMFGDIIPSLPSKTASRPKSKPRPKKVNAPVEPPLKTRPKPATSTYANVNLSQATLNGDPDPHLPVRDPPNIPPLSS
jgi:hypothetical protein